MFQDVFLPTVMKASIVATMNATWEALAAE
jgi:hypothetical protein